MGNGDFRRLWAGTGISALGSWLLIVAVPVHVHQVTGSAMATSLALAVEALPALVIGPWAGALIDRWDRRAVLASASVACAGGISLMPAGGLTVVYLGLLAESAAAVFLMPAMRALLPDIAGRGPELAVANSIVSTTSAVMRMVGPVAGAFVYVQGGLTLIVVLDAASYLVAAGLFASIRIRSRGSSAGLGIGEGLRYVATVRPVRAVLLTSWIFWTANAGLTALFVPFVVGRLGGTGVEIGYLITALGLGYVVGAAISARFLGTHLMVMGCVATGACFFVLFNAPTMAVALVAVFAAGVPGSVVGVIIAHSIQVRVPSTLLGRVSAAFGVSDAAAAVTGAGLAAGLVVWLPQGVCSTC